MAELVYRDIAMVLLDLPERCAIRLNTTGEPILLRRGHKGYWPLSARFNVDAFNERQGVTPEQLEAMETGSMFGFDVPGADPANCGYRRHEG